MHRITFLLGSQEPVLETLVFDKVCDPAPRILVVLRVVLRSKDVLSWLLAPDVYIL